MARARSRAKHTDSIASIAAAGVLVGGRGAARAPRGDVDEPGAAVPAFRRADARGDRGLRERADHAAGAGDAGGGAGPLRGLGPMLANVSAVGLGADVAERADMVWSRWGGPGSLPGLFWVKFVFVLSLTAAAVAIQMTYRAVRGGDTAAAARLTKLGPVAGVSALLAVLLAVYAFS